VSTLDEVFAIALEPEGGQEAPTAPAPMEEAEDHAEVHAAV
jgi:hypothetical protein